LSELTYDDLIRELFPRLTGGIRWGLERTAALLSAVHNPQQSFRSVHIGGTNGKGSVAATISAILVADGRHTGLYTSPHLCTFRERIQIDGKALSEAQLVDSARKLWPHIQLLGPSFFEATTAIGFLALAEAGVETAVVEVGLGGRLDATNVILPDLAVITNIALDHADYLGNTIESIAREKAGIIKPGVPVLTAEHGAQPLRIFQQFAGERLVRVEPPARVDFDVSGTRFSLGALEYRTPLIGYHQAVNAVLAVEACRRLPDPPSASAVQNGVASVTWPGRMQVESIANQTWVFDVAHNVAGVQALVAATRGLRLPRPLVVVVGILGDKDWQGMLPPLVDLADAVVLTRPPTAPSSRAWQPEEALRVVASEHAHVREDFQRALTFAHEQAARGTVLVTGSFHTVGDALIALGRAPSGSDLILPRVAFSG